MVLKVLYHARCLDGLASAAVFTRFYRECVDSAGVTYEGLTHGAPKPIDPGLLDGDVNAIVDFRYSTSDRLHWWFDHHRSAFVSAEDRKRFESERNPQHHWDPDAPSCTGFIARVCSDRFGLNAAPLHDLVHWLDIVDAAQFSSPEMAVELREPALQLMTVAAHLEDGTLAERIISGLATGDIDGVAGLPDVQARFRPLRKAQQDALREVKSRLVRTADVALIDLAGMDPGAFNKFAPYYLEPDLTYAVIVGPSARGGIKIGVGSNPWRPDQRRHDIAAICEQFGGGGHAVVGGITLDGAAIGVGRQIAADIVDQLLVDEEPSS